MTAEFAVILPAVLVLLSLIIGGVMLASVRLSLVSAAYDLARLEARGDAHLVTERLTQTPTGTTFHVDQQDILTCVTLTAQPGAGILRSITITAHGCAVRHTTGNY